MSHRNTTYREHLPTASDARAVRTRSALRRALLELLEKRPLDQIAIRDIAEAANIGYATFYRHHPTKESLLDDLAAQEIRRLVDLTLPVMDDKSAKAASDALCDYIEAHWSLWSTFLTGGAAGALRAEFLRIALGIAASRSRPAAWSPAELGTRLIVGGTIEILTWWLSQSRPMPKGDVAELHLKTVVQPVMQTIVDGGRWAVRDDRAAPRRRTARSR
ncbi:MAG TPA: TetR/AcrR family transcriptional regulator [Nevskiaceae bacterium]|nr:TetR/AcrR family transcriptional regulator [Nevskiaceae bacterium]